MAAVIENAFWQRLQLIIPTQQSRLRILTEGVDRSAAIGAWVSNELVGVVGLKTPAVSVFGPMTLGLLRAELGAGAIKTRLALALLDRPLEPGTVRIEFLAVDESARGSGVGTSLLRDVEQRTCEEHIVRLELYVEAENLDAQRLYLREGFQPAPGRADSAWRRWLLNQTDIRMIKEIQCTTS